MKVEWSPRAFSDLRAISDYIEHDTSAETADRVTRAVFDATQTLFTTPYRGRPGRMENTRELIIQGLPWIAIYRVSEERVVIINIIHGARRWP